MFTSKYVKTYFILCDIQNKYVCGATKKALSNFLHKRFKNLYPEKVLTEKGNSDNKFEIYKCYTQPLLALILKVSTNIHYLFQRNQVEISELNCKTADFWN